MAIKAVQQIMLGTVTGNEKEARETLAAVKAAGYEGIELNSFMVHPTPLLVRLLTKAAGMPTGKGGKLDWAALVKEAGLKVVSLHTDLGSLERDRDGVVDEAKKYGTSNLVITGMYRFDYRDTAAVTELCRRLDEAGKRLKEKEINLLYHNHNYEFQRLNPEPQTTREDMEFQRAGAGQNAYDYMVAHTNPAWVNFEFDSYWPTEAGVPALAVMKKLGSRMKLYHINDRGTRLKKPAMTPILQSDSMELGYGNMDLTSLTEQALEAGVEAIVLESHKNWIHGSPVESLECSAAFLKEQVK